MKLTGKSGFALILIGCGALILLGKFGWAFGHLFSLIVPIAMVVLGYIGLTHGRKIIGTVLLALGVIILLGKLSGLIGLILAIGMIAYGVSMLKKPRTY